MTRYLPCGLLSLSGLTALLLPRCSTSCFGRVYAELFIQPCPCLLAADASVFALEQTIPSSSLPGLQRFVFSGPYQDTAKFPKGDFSSSSFKRSQQRSRCPISYSSLTTCRPQEQFLPGFSPGFQCYAQSRSATVPGGARCWKRKEQKTLSRSWDTSEYARSCAWSPPSLLALTTRTCLYGYILQGFSIYRGLKDGTLVEYIHAKFSFECLYSNLSFLASNLYHPGNFCSVSILFYFLHFSSTWKNQNAFSSCTKC